MAATQMTSLLNTLANTDMVILALSAKFEFDPVEGRQIVAAAFARAIQAEHPLDAKQAVAETSGLANTKPARVPAAFDLWSKENRAAVRTGLPEDTKSAEVTKALREAWKTLEDDVKAPFVEESKRLRAAAKPPTDPNAKRVRRKKDPNAPKAPKNAYMRFADTVRDSVIAAARAELKEDQKIKMSEIAKLIGQMWKETPADEKAPFEQEFEADKVRYATEKTEYVAKLEAQAAGAAAAAPAAEEAGEADAEDSASGSEIYD
jgi:hypothetical protein